MEVYHEFGFGYVELEVPLSHLRGDIEKAIGCMSLQLREVWAGDKIFDWFLYINLVSCNNAMTILSFAFKTENFSEDSS